MKYLRSFKSRLAAALALAVLLLAQSGAQAQIPGGNANGAMNVIILRLFGANTNFIAKLDVRVLDKSMQETGAMSMGFNRLGDKVRYDIDMAQVKSREMPPEFAKTLKEIRLDRFVTIRLPEKKTILTIYPALKACVETPMDKDEVLAGGNVYKIEKTPVGRETIDGHPCEKNNVTITGPGGRKDHAILWNATDLKDFPVQMQITSEDTTLVFKYRDVKLGRPELSQFETPGGLTRYNDINALQTAAANSKPRGASSAK